MTCSWNVQTVLCDRTLQVFLLILWFNNSVSSSIFMLGQRAAAPFQGGLVVFLFSFYWSLMSEQIKLERKLTKQDGSSTSCATALASIVHQLGDTAAPNTARKRYDDLSFSICSATILGIRQMLQQFSHSLEVNRYKCCRVFTLSIVAARRR